MGGKDSMALAGKLEVLQAAELFHLISLFKQTSKLTLTAEEAAGYSVDQCQTKSLPSRSWLTV
jgi:hypothetical protein